MTEENKQQTIEGFVEDYLIMIPVETMRVFMRAEDPADVCALYMFYCYTAKWQKTNQPKATDGYSRKGLNIGRVRIERAQKFLVANKFIEKIVKRDTITGMISGWYVKVNYRFHGNLYKKAVHETALNETMIFENANKTHLFKNEQVGILPLDCLATSGQTTTNALSNINTNAYLSKQGDVLPEYKIIALLLKDEIKKNDPGAVITDAQIKKWADVVRLMAERDKRPLDQIKEVLLFSQKHDFWRTNILSMGTLRDKYTRLVILMKPKQNSTLNRERGLAYAVSKKPANI